MSEQLSYDSIQQITALTGVDLFKLGQVIKSEGGLSIGGTDIWFPDGTASSVLSLNSNRKITFTAGTGITGSGTINTVPKFTAVAVIGDSRIVDDGTDIIFSMAAISSKFTFSGTGSNTATIAYDYPGAGSDALITYTPGTNKGTWDFSVRGYSCLNIMAGANTTDKFSLGDITGMSGVSGFMKIRPQAGGYDTICVLQQEATAAKPFLKCLDSAGTLKASIANDGTAHFTALILDTVLPVTSGGTGLATVASGSIIAANALDTVSAITSIAGLKVLKNNAGTVSWNTVTGTGDNVMATSPTLVTPVLGAATATSIAIGANTLDTNEWAYLDGQDQAVKTTSNVTHGIITATTGIRTGDSTATMTQGDVLIKRASNTYGVCYLSDFNYALAGGSGFGDIRLLVNAAYRFYVTDNDNVICGSQAALATNAVNGFTYIPSCAGTPTGVPTSYTGKVPMVYDSTNFVLYVYAGGSWRTH